VKIEKPTAGGLPPWAYAAFGGGIVLFVLLIGALVVDLNSSTSPSSKQAHVDDSVVATTESQATQKADNPPTLTEVLAIGKA
jgi:hypothetical protein